MNLVIHVIGIRYVDIGKACFMSRNL